MEIIEIGLQEDLPHCKAALGLKVAKDELDEYAHFSKSSNNNNNIEPIWKGMWKFGTAHFWFFFVV